MSDQYLDLTPQRQRQLEALSVDQQYANVRMGEIVSHAQPWIRCRCGGGCATPGVSCPACGWRMRTWK